MNAKTEQQIANLKTQTIGVEIEMNHITRKNAAKLAADFFGTGRYEDTEGRTKVATAQSRQSAPHAARLLSRRARIPQPSTASTSA